MVYNSHWQSILGYFYILPNILLIITTKRTTCNFCRCKIRIPVIGGRNIMATLEYCPSITGGVGVIYSSTCALFARKVGHNRRCKDRDASVCRMLILHWIGWLVFVQLNMWMHWCMMLEVTTRWQCVANVCVKLWLFVIKLLNTVATVCCSHCLECCSSSACGWLTSAPIHVMRMLIRCIFGSLRSHALNFEKLQKVSWFISTWRTIMKSKFVKAVSGQAC